MRKSASRSQLKGQFLIWGALFSSVAYSATSAAPVPTKINQEVTVQKANQSEQHERSVDEVAMASQNKAIEQLSGLLQRYKGKRQEPILLFKMSELQSQNASILFRIAHGSSHRKNAKLDLSRFNKANNSVISTLNTLITKYPDYAEVAQAYFARGKAYEEIENKGLAARDFRHLVEHYPDAPEVASAYMSLAQFSIDANDHAQAIGYLQELEKRPDSPHFPFALYKLAWSHYNLKHIELALSYAQRQVAYYRERQKANAALADQDSSNVLGSDFALTENTLLDIPIFYFSGYEEHNPKYPLDEALGYFKKTENGDLLGKMVLRFAKMLRSRGNELDLARWKDQVLVSELARPETVDIVATVFEHQLNKRRYEQVVATAEDLIKLYAKQGSSPNFVKAQKMLIDAAEGLQTLIVKNKSATEVPALTKNLASLYAAFTQIVDEKDARIPRVHYNLAETLFAIRDFPAATLHYRWVVEHWRARSDDEEGSRVVADASIKAIGSRYEILRLNKLIPGELKAVSFSQNSEAKLDPSLTEWIDWIHHHMREYPKDLERTQNFIFESNRALYAQNHIKDAVYYFKDFTNAHPESSLAVPSASLVLDTFIAGNDWELTQTTAERFLKSKVLKESPFGKHLHAVAGDAFYKRIELKSKEGKNAEVMQLSDEFNQHYETSARVGDSLILAGTAALNSSEPKVAMKYFTMLLETSPDSENAGQALLHRATLQENSYAFSGAAYDYQAFLGLPAAVLKKAKGDLDPIRKKLLMLTWLSGDEEQLGKAVRSSLVCTESTTAECEKFKILLSLQTTVDPGLRAAAFERAREAKSEKHALWGMLALDGAKDLGFKDRFLMVKTVISGWKELDPIIQFALLSKLTTLVPKIFALNRDSLREIAPLKANAKSITRRVEVIQEMENAATQAMSLPWSRLRAQVLSEMATVYLSLAKEIGALPPPADLSTSDQEAYAQTVRGIVIPFEEKGQDMRSKAFEIASRASIEVESFRSIAEPFFLENPSQAKRLKPQAPVAQMGVALDLAFMNHVEPEGKWLRIKYMDEIDYNDRPWKLRIQWSKSLKEKNWAQVAFFMQEAHLKALVPASILSAMKAVSFAAAGARAEGLLELEENRKTFAAPIREFVLATLLEHAISTCSKEKSLTYLKEMDYDHLSRDELALFASAEAYTEFSRLPATVKAPGKKTQ